MSIEYAPTESLTGVTGIYAALSYMQMEDDEFFLIGGASLVMRDVISETSGIDMLVAPEALAWLSNTDGARLVDPLGPDTDNPTIVIENQFLPVPIFAATSVGTGNHSLSYDEHRSHVELITGIPCIPLAYVKKVKQALRRPKDIHHLEGIFQFMGESFDYEFDCH